MEMKTCLCNDRVQFVGCLMGSMWMYIIGKLSRHDGWVSPAGCFVFLQKSWMTGDEAILYIAAGLIQME